MRLPRTLHAPILRARPRTRRSDQPMRLASSFGVVVSGKVKGRARDMSGALRRGQLMLDIHTRDDPIFDHLLDVVYLMLQLDDELRQLRLRYLR
jgi:hypothetical protein